MATISGASNEKIYSIPKWLGLNEHPDGDTRLKLGEASQMVNWKITRDGNLKRRPGQEFVAGLRLSYLVQAAATATEIPLGSGKVECFSIASAMENPGKVTLSGSLGEMSFAEMAEETDPVYFHYDERVWKFAEEGAAYRLTAEPSNGLTRPIAGMWSGLIGGKEHFLVACDGQLWELWDATNNAFQRYMVVGAINTSKGVSFFPFDSKVYILNGYEYYVYDGTTLSAVEGYRPLVAIALGPVVTGDAVSSGTTTGEYVNRLNGKRRVWLSPDGTGTTFQMPEKGLAQADWVKDLGTGQEIASGWTMNTETGQIVFNTAPAKSVNSIEVAYSVPVHTTSNDGIPDYRGQVTGNLFAELYSGTTDTRVFIYGDGTNRTLYSGMDYDGMPRADYFPDQYEVHVGDANTPITSMVRHYGNLVCYKPDSCWNLQHGVVELATSELTPAIYCVPVNRDMGHLAPGQVRLVENNPVTCFGHDLYRWVGNSRTGTLSRDERQSRRVSSRVQATIQDYDLAKCATWDDNDNQEYYVCYDKKALVWNYANDTWYTYEGIDAVQLCNFHGELYFGTSDGKVFRLTYSKSSDDGDPIYAYWLSGAMDFSADYSRKYSSMMWVGLKPEEGTWVNVTVQTDRKDSFREKVVSSTKAKVPGEPFMVKTKIKAKKFVYYRLALYVDEKEPAVTVTNVDFRVRPTGYAK